MLQGGTGSRGGGTCRAPTELSVPAHGPFHLPRADAAPNPAPEQVGVRCPNANPLARCLVAPATPSASADLELDSREVLYGNDRGVRGLTERTIFDVGDFRNLTKWPAATSSGSSNSSTLCHRP